MAMVIDLAGIAFLVALTTFAFRIFRAGRDTRRANRSAAHSRLAPSRTGGYPNNHKRGSR